MNNSTYVPVQRESEWPQKIHAEHKTRAIRQKKKNTDRKEEMTGEHSTVQEKLP